MKILALDTATEACSVALLTADGLLHEDFRVAPQQHAQIIMPMIKKILTAADMSLSQLDAIAFAQGPGSFTGVRIAAGIIQGLAFAADLPVVPVSTLATLAQVALDEFNTEWVLAGIDARMQEVYWGMFKKSASGIMAPVNEMKVVLPTMVAIPDSGQWIGVGSAWDSYTAVLKQRIGGQLSAIKYGIYPRASAVARIAQVNYLRGEYVTAVQAIPVYLRDQVTNMSSLLT